MQSLSQRRTGRGIAAGHSREEITAYGRALDNRLGGFVLAMVLRELATEGERPAATVYALNAVQEEIGGHGARMAAYIGSHGTEAFGGGAHPAPAAVVMAYTAHSDVADEEPPTFVVTSALR